MIDKIHILFYIETIKAALYDVKNTLITKFKNLFGGQKWPCRMKWVNTQITPFQLC